MKQKASGKLISLNDGPSSLIHYTQDSWWEHLLCKACEETVRDYETYGFQLLRSARLVRVKKHSQGITLGNHEYKRFKLFLTSLIWRMAVSKQPPFAKVLVPEPLLEVARISLLQRNPLGPLRFGAKIARLNDSTPKSRGGFTLDVLKHLIMAPVPRLYGRRSYYAFVTVFEGFMFEFFVPAIPHNRRMEHGVHRKSRTLFVPYIDVKEAKEVFGFMVHAYGKSHRGEVTFES